MDQSAEIIANGTSYSISAGMELSSFVSDRGLALDRVVVEYNGQAVTPAEATSIRLQAGDRLEIVRIVAGG